ncbi:RNA polymerase sigma-70 factor, ECF subfamily [Frankineae bacterium MT45]|nr:RNA polymerase sigma-70 factor, ECF subfamily [Frankineae bacterium MT45]
MEDAERRIVTDEWFRAYSSRVLAYLLHRTDPQTAQDVLQEVFVTAFGKAEEITESPLGWLFGAARRLLANRYRGFRRHDELIARLMDDASLAADSDEIELKQAFAHTLASLPAGDREVLTLTGWYDLTPAQAAQALGCNPATYAVKLHRARKRLAAALDAAGYRGSSPAGQLAAALRG